MMNILRKTGSLAAVGAGALALGLLGRIAVGEDAVTAYPDHYKVEFENDQVRVIRINYGPGESTGMHEHGPGVVVNLSNMRVKFTLPDGTTQEDDTSAGSFNWSDAGMHAAENMGGEAQALYIEFK